MKGPPRTQFKSHLEMRPCDYERLELAAKTVIKRTGTRCPIEDLIDVGWQKVFFYAKTYEHFEHYGYLHAIRAMGRYLIQHKTQELQLDTDMEDALTVDGQESTAEELDEAVRFLAKCRPKWREVVILHLWKGLTFTEIAKKMSCSPALARYYYRKALTHARSRRQTSER